RSSGRSGRRRPCLKERCLKERCHVLASTPGDPDLGGDAELGARLHLVAPVLEAGVAGRGVPAVAAARRSRASHSFGIRANSLKYATLKVSSYTLG
ncbi:unnamed protein product, partial [Prorocentrum cordatum]